MGKVKTGCVCRAGTTVLMSFLSLEEGEGATLLGNLIPATAPAVPAAILCQHGVSTRLAPTSVVGEGRPVHTVG